ncbi:hypothetical protein AVEN_108548-1 [Araneus ventricosus]|uniref:Uncharacterized protein n=1 Tax=Araneus ventricosus TaxID=182803 RepID=A0A4Y2M6B2_ARAVE|nr:hypothetical protein AVEN_108548-1 [Araneus ventricosus]
MNNYIIILGSNSLGDNYSFAPTSHRVKKSLDKGERHLLPFFLKLRELFIGTVAFLPTRRSSSSVHTPSIMLRSEDWLGQSRENQFWMCLDQYFE